jgi:hypothetical protein
MQRRWGSIVAGYTVEQVKDLICEVTSADDDFATYSLLLILKYRWDCPDPVFDLLDDICLGLGHQSSSPLVSPTLLCVWSRRDDLPSVRPMLFDNGPLLVQWRRRSRPPGTWVVVLITLVGCLFVVFYAHIL